MVSAARAHFEPVFTQGVESEVDVATALTCARQARSPSPWTGRGIWKAERGKIISSRFFWLFLNTLLADEFNDAIERFTDFSRVTAARLREVGTPAARAADNRRNLLDNVSRFDPRRQVGSHRDDQRGLALTKVRANRDDGRAVLLPQPVGH